MFGDNKNDHKIQDSNNDVHTYSYIKDQDTVLGTVKTISGTTLRNLHIYTRLYIHEALPINKINPTIDHL